MDPDNESRVQQFLPKARTQEQQFKGSVERLKRRDHNVKGLESELAKISRGADAGDTRGVR